MDNIKTFCFTSLGESHKKINKVCQDSSICKTYLDKGIYIGAVSDGHGSATYFRSDKGSEFLTDIAVKNVKKFIDNINDDFFDSKFTAVPVSRNIEGPLSEQNKSFSHLFSSIILEWNEAIKADWKKETPSVDKMRDLNVPDSNIKMFENSECIELAYGCTLIVFVRTKNYWFTFQLGDGTCMLYDKSFNWSEPIISDDRCEGNVTTSICEEDAVDSFRYCYGNTDFPLAILIASDGLDGAYGNMYDLSVFYDGIIKSILTDGYEVTVREIEDYLPKLSTKGLSKDDMSIVGLLDIKQLNEVKSEFISKEINNLKNDLKIKEDFLKKNEDINLEYRYRIEDSKNVLNTNSTISKPIKEIYRKIKKKFEYYKAKIDKLENYKTYCQSSLDIYIECSIKTEQIINLTKKEMFLIQDKLEKYNKNCNETIKD